jgi:two-component system, cell cycle sensor histidine kinase and response regulator CckA
MTRTPLRVVIMSCGEHESDPIRDLLSAEETFRVEVAPSPGAVAPGAHDACVFACAEERSSCLELVRRLVGADVARPVVFVGPAEPELDLAALKAGAADFLKRGALTAPLLARSVRYAVERNRAAERTLFQVRLLDMVEQAAIAVDLDGRIIFWNRYAETLYGWRADEALGRHILDVTPAPAARGLADEIVFAMASGRGWTGEFPVRRRDGTEFLAHISNSPILDERGALAGFVGLSFDVTERRRAEEDRVRLAAIVQSSDDAIISKDLGGTIMTWNAGAERMYGHTAAEAVGRRISLIIPEDRPGELDGLLARIARAEHIQHFETVRVRKDGSRVDVSLSISPLENASGEVIGASMIARDITARKRTEAALRESEERYRRILDTAQEGVWLVDTEARTVFANRRMAAMLGYEPGELAGRTLFEFMSDDTARAMARRFESRRRGVAEQYDMRLRSKSGAEMWAMVSATPIFDEDGAFAGALGMVTDITERKELERQFRQAQRMEAVGRLAGGVAHDFNNLLTVITGYSDLVSSRLHPGDPLREDISEIRAAADRAAALTRQLLAFSRKQVLSPRVVDLNATVENMLKMLERLIGEDVALEVEAGEGIGRVRVDPAQVEQVIVNLAVNARDAMPRGGRLRIATREELVGEERAGRDPDASPGAYAVFSMEDTGEGMSEETMSRIFEPFFTTKDEGRGTGLGLATVYGIVRQSGGFVEVESAPGRGSTFRVFLPVVAGADTAGPGDAAPAEPSRGAETVLVVEDQPEVRRLACEALRRYGYTVLEAGNGGEALLICEQEAAPIHAVVTDVVMPRMSGRQLVERLATLRPGLRALFMSGHTDDTVIAHGVLEGGLPFLQKPFTPDALARKVREVLDGK